MSTVYTPIFPIICGKGIMPAAPVKFSTGVTSDSKIVGLKINSTIGNDRVLLITKNGTVVQEISDKMASSNGIVPLDQTIESGDIFRVHGEGNKFDHIYGSFITNVAASNVYRDYGASATSDLSFNSGADGGGITSKSISQLTVSEKTADTKGFFIDGRKISLVIPNTSSNGWMLYKENTAGRTGTNFYIRFMIAESTTNADSGNSVGVAFMVQSGSYAGYLAKVSAGDNDHAGYIGITRFSNGSVLDLENNQYAKILENVNDNRISITLSYALTC